MKQGIMILVVFLIFFSAKNSDIVFGKNEEIKAGKIESIIEELKRGKSENRDVLINMGEDIIPVLIQKSQSDDVGTRRVSLELLGRIDKKDDEILNKKEIVKTMVQALKDRDHKVVNKALDFLMDIENKMIDKGITAALIEQLDKGNGKAARILGKSGNTSLIPVLEKYLGKNVGMTINVRQSLAKLGEKKYLNEIMAELESESYNTCVNAIRELGYIGNKEAIRKIAEFLFNTENPKSGSPGVEYTPYRFIAAETMQKIISNPPVRKKVAGLYSEEDIQLWRNWWQKNKHQYESLVSE
jgi:hypothetical protein